MPRNIVDFYYGLVDFFACGRLLFTGRGNGAHLIGGKLDAVDDMRQRLARLRGKIRGDLNLAQGNFHNIHAFGRACLYGRYGVAHIVGGGHETFGSSGNLGGINFGRVWTGSQDQTGCLPPCITFALFMVCLAQFGFLAGIGFVFFHTIGSAMGVLRDVRQFSTGRLPNPWAWRLCNWGLSFLLTAWLAGAFH